MKRALLSAFSLVLAFLPGCKRTDPALAADLRKEIAAYIATFPALKAEENGAIRVIEAAKALKPLPAEAEKDGFDPATPDGSIVMKTYLAENGKTVDALASALAAEKFRYTAVRCPPTLTRPAPAWTRPSESTRSRAKTWFTARKAAVSLSTARART